MEADLREAVHAAAGRADVSHAVAAVYTALADAIAIRRPICKTSGRCCRFEEFGHRLYLTTLELATFVRDLPTLSQSTSDVGPSVPTISPLHPITPSPSHSLSILAPTPPSAAEHGCRFQINGLCGAHAIRPFGCRVFFCDETSTQWQHDIYERMHAQLRTLHDQLQVPYFYVEWRYALKVCL